jgi:hypothetical protein
MESLDPPAANGTTNVIGLAGQFCAAADEMPSNDAAIIAIIRILSGSHLQNHFAAIVHISSVLGMSACYGVR